MQRIEAAKRSLVDAKASLADIAIEWGCGDFEALRVRPGQYLPRNVR